MQTKEVEHSRPVLVSVIVPAYNAAKFITCALDSIVAQTYRPLEIIVVDDGSYDDTSTVVKTYFSSYREKINFIYLYQSNRGPSQARNVGIKAAKGEFIAFLDADDSWTPHKLAKQMACLERHVNIALLFSDMSIINETTIIVESCFDKYRRPIIDNVGKLLNPFEQLVVSNFIPTSTVITRKYFLQKSGLFDETLSYAEDYDLWLRLSLTGEIFCIPEVLELKRIHKTNLSHNEQEFFKSKIYLLTKLKNINLPYSHSMQLTINKSIVAAFKKYIYFYYCKRKYLDALMVLYSFLEYMTADKFKRA